MAASFDGTRIANADSLAPTTPVDGEWTDLGGGACSLETDFFYEGTNSASEQVKGSEGGTCFTTNTATYNASGSNLNFLLKGTVTTSGLLEATRATGQKFEIGSGSTEGTGRPTNYLQYYTYYDATYPPKESWIIHVFDVQEIGYIDNHVGGSTDDTAIDYWGQAATMTGSVKSQNVATDAIDYITAGQGLTWTGSGGEFQDFIDLDEGTTTNRWGVVTTREGVIYCLAVLALSDTSSTTFTDSNKKIIFPWTYVAEGAQGIDIDLSHVSTAVTLNICSFTGNGTPAVKKWFDTALDTDAGTDYITIADHGFETGDHVLYSREGGSDDIGPEPSVEGTTDHWIYVNSSSTFGLCTSRVNAFAGTVQALTVASAPGENQSVIKNPDNRIDYTVSGTTASTGFVANSCIFEGIRVMTLTSKCFLTAGFIQSIGNVAASTATITNVLISGATLGEGVALFDPLAGLDDITYCTFDGGGTHDGGHAVEITSTGSTDSTGNLFNNYWEPTVSGSNLGWNFHTQTGVDSNIVTTNAAHGFTTGDAVFYNTEGGTDSINLTNGNKYYVDVASTTTFTVHLTRSAAVAGSSIITLADGSGGETHSFYSSKAAVFNDTGGSVTINALDGGDVPSYRNGTGASTTATAAVTIEVTGVTEGTRCVILRTSDSSQLLNALAYTSDGAGAFKASTGFSYTSDVDVYVSAGSSGKVVAGVADNTTVFTDETRQANDSRTGAGNTMTLIPAATPATPDGFYFGHTEQFLQMDLDVLTAGIGTYTIAWEYWNGSWTSLSGLSDGTNNYKNSGSNRISWTTPAGWAVTTVTNQPGTTSLYYVRARFVSGTVTTTPIGRAAQLDVTKYGRWETESVITSSGLSLKATWIVDNTATF